MNRPPSEDQRRRRLVTRALPLAVVAAIAFIAGASTGSQSSPEKAAAERWVEAWAKQDFAAMRTELNPASKREVSLDELTTAFEEAQETATLSALDPGGAEDPSSEDGTTVVPVPMRVETTAFGEIEAELRLPFADGGIVWEESLVFPGLQTGEELASDVRLATRAPILARDRSPLAEGPVLAREHPQGDSSIDVTGEVGTAEPSELEALAREGFPPGTTVGISGLEQAFNSRLAGKPGGELTAQPAGGGEPRVLGSSEPVPGKRVKTTIDLTLQESAVSALAGRSGGVAVLDARTGAVRALAGQAFSAPQPPGSTYKMITTTAALQKGIVSLDDEFPITNGINVGGRFIYNAGGEYCGGTFEEAFHESCNAVFAPLGPEIGNDDFVAIAERFGFNSKPTLYDEAATRTIDPPGPTMPEEIGDDLDLGVSAIGQGEILATPLSMASVAQTIANDGLRMPTPIVTRKELQADADPVRVMNRDISNTLTELMIGVVTSGTGTAGAIAEAQVAGKTGTAELGPEPGQENLPNPIQIKTAWFAAFAPADDPRLVVCVMLIDAGASGGEVAAPAAAQVLSAGL